MKNRPLSPHLTIYKSQITSFVSIYHRISGAFLTISSCFIFLALFVDICFSEYFLTYFAYFQFFHVVYWYFVVFGLFLFLLFGFHFFNGIRHVFWDFTIGLDIKNLLVTGGIVLCITIFALFLVVF